MTILPDHIKREKSWKTVCVTASLTFIGIPVDAFQVTSTKRNVHAWKGVIRRNGFALRSRRSSIPKGVTVGGVRQHIRKMNDPAGTFYMIHVKAHLLVLDQQGNTVVDTDPRKVDKRKVLGIDATWRR